MEEEEEDIHKSTPEELKKISSSISFIPEVSKKVYEKEYLKFAEFLSKYNRLPQHSSQNIVLSYISLLSNAGYSPTTLRKTYSILKITLLEKFNIYVESEKIEKYLKNLEKKHTKKKSATFTQEHISFFLQNADDSIFLLEKFLILVAIYGALRCEEITRLTWEDIKEEKDKLVISIQFSKTTKNKVETFVCCASSNEKESVLFYFEKYRNQFQNGARTGRLWRRFNVKSQSREKSPIGHNTISKIPFKIPTFLEEKMKNFNKAPSAYTGHCFRRTAATWAADFGVSVINLKRFGRWKSEKVAMEYVDDSSKTKEEIAKSVSLSEIKKSEEIIKISSNSESLPLINFSSASFNNCSINISYNEKK